MPATNHPIRPSSRGPVITVIGLSADGWADLSPALRQVVLTASVVIGGRRHLALLPDVPDQRREPWPTPLRDGLPALLEGLGSLEHPGTDRPIVALASGDPLVSGIGSTLIDLLGPQRVRIHPAISSVALARAALGWPAESCAVVSVVGRHPSRVLRECAPGRRVLVLSSDESTPAAVAGLLTDVGYGASRMHVLGDLGSAQASRLDGLAHQWATHTPPMPRLHIIGLELVGAPRGSWVAGLPDTVFEHDGQLTKRDLRASALSRLAPVPGEHLWDVGAGAGSVGIEWMRAHPSCTATAIEADAARAQRIARNAANLGVPALQVVEGRAPEALTELPAPDAVFIGGGATRPGVVDRCLQALRPGGRMVVHAVTLQTEMAVGALHAQWGGELTRLAVETSAPIGSFTGWTPLRTVTQWAFTSEG